ncbi:MAG: protein kinase domain-containing protein [Gammaproteobacteria bacterium]
MERKTDRNALQTGYRIHWYELSQTLGRGCFGITYLARDLNLAQLVAIKEYLPVELALRDVDLSVCPLSERSSEAYQQGLQRFIREARTLARFNHPSIVRVLSVFEENRTAYMVMSYEDGESLDNLLSQGKRFSEAELKSIVLPILEGLADVHRGGFIHRDIKPANIFIRKRDGSPVLLDFGSARQTLPGDTRSLTSVVSPGYAPFEQYSGNGEKQGPWTDIYGLGATLYRAVVGVSPTDAIARSEALLKTSRDSVVSATEAAGGGYYSRKFLQAIDHAIRFDERERPKRVTQWAQELRGQDNPQETLSELPRITNPDAKIEAPTRVMTAGASGSKARPSSPIRVALILLLAGAGAAWHYDLVEIPKRQPPFAEPEIAEKRLPTDTPVISTNPGNPQPSREEISAVTVQPRSKAERVAELLSLARQDLDELRLSPKGDNALELFRAALDLDPKNPVAIKGIQDVLQRYLTMAETAIDKGAVLEAERYLAKAAKIDPTADALLRSQRRLGVVKNTLLRRTLPRPVAPAPQTPHPSAEPPAEDITHLLTRASNALISGRLFGPPGDNAVELYRRAKQLYPQSGAVKRGLVDLGNKLLDLADQASYSGNFAQAEAYLDEAEALLPHKPEIQSARWYVVERRASRERAVAREKTYQGRGQEDRL